MGRKPGRKPIGKRAMTGAERLRRWREKHRPVTKPVTEPAASQLQARIRQLEAELARVTAMNAGLMARYAHLEERQTRLDPSGVVAVLRQLKAEFHPDKAPEGPIRDYMHGVFIRANAVLDGVGRHQKRAAQKDFDWAKARQETRERNSRRAKEAHARRKAKASAETVT